MDDLMQEFLTDTTDNLNALDNELVRLEKNPNDSELLGRIFRLVHTVKGNCGFLGLPRLENVAHHAENVLGQYRSGAVPVTQNSVSLILQSLDCIKGIVGGIATTGAEPPGEDAALIELLDRAAAAAKAPVPAPSAAFQSAAEEIGAKSLRVSVDALESIMTLVGELVLARNQLLPHMSPALMQPLTRLDKTVSALQEGVLKARMQPVGHVWAKFPRLVRDIAIDLNKKIRLEMSGETAELDRQVLELIRDPLMHLLRNAADHGIELPAERVTRGKTPDGTIRLSARQEGGQVIIEVADDGRGLDNAAILRKAVSAGIVPEQRARGLSPAQVQQLIFAPGFSMAPAVTALSGRGVGMDVVRANIEKIGGTVGLSSVQGRGTTVTLAIPLTLAIIPALVISSDNERYAVPRNMIREIVSLKRGGPHRIQRVDDAKFLPLRGQLLPLVTLQQVFGGDNNAAKALNPFVLVLQVGGGGAFGLVCDSITGSEEIVVKPLSPALRKLRLFSGDAVLGDGGVVLILDPAGLVRESGIDPAPPEQVLKMVAVVRRPALLFRAGPGAKRALPLENLSRIESVPLGQLEGAGDRLVLPYGEGLLPVFAAVPPAPGRKKQTMLVLKSGNRQAGFLVQEVLDIVDNLPPISLRQAGRHGIAGESLVNGEAVDVIDAEEIIASLLVEAE